MECLTCKKHFSQGGNCMENKHNCLMYDEEPRGRILRTNIMFKIDNNAETPIIKYGSKVKFIDNGKEIEMTIININWVNLETMICSVEADYYELEKPYCEKKKIFKIIK